MTSIVDNFNRADSTTTLGTTSDGNATWSTTFGSQSSIWGISSNRAYLQTDSPPDIAWIDPAFADGIWSVRIAVQLGSTMGLIFRMSDGNNYWLVDQLASNQGKLLKLAAGTFTQVGSTFTCTIGSTITAQAVGSSITIQAAGTTVLTATDTFNQTATKVGMQNTNVGATAGAIDDFSASTIAPAPAYSAARINVHSRAVARASVV